MIEEGACERAWGPCCWGRPWFGEKWRTRISLGPTSNHHTLHGTRSMALSDCTLPARALPPSFPCLLLFGRARRFSPPSLPLSCEKAGAGRRRTQKAHAQPLHSRLRVAGTASAVCACALRHCGFNSFRVCLRLDPCFELRVKHKISTILNQLLPSCILSRNPFCF